MLCYFNYDNNDLRSCCVGYICRKYCLDLRIFYLNVMLFNLGFDFKIVFFI